uniref:AlNc14C5G714 protein n=1 Tax=Albugo laibachii Nc14 TaxID=890382 RepID=F0W0S9_9STRA|nr:AlNc14C5G714 [Albugo laibachii Nc14]|eukprot:CCA14653.1 AlNc14C5G714 [Albugo laibachii Nc14]
MKSLVARALEHLANVLVGSFTATFTNELRIMAEASGSSAARAMRANGIPMNKVIRHTAGAVAKL